MLKIETVVLSIVLCLSLIADIKKGKIYNWITLPAIVLGLGLSVILYKWGGLKSSAIGLGVGFGAFLIIYLFLGGLGGGDVKLMGAIGAISGYPFILGVMFYSILVGAIMAIAKVIWKKKFLKTTKNVLWYFLSRVSRFHFAKTHLDPKEQDTIPFSIAIVLGTIWAILMDKVVGSQLPILF
jgi:prepilin peptidase CpaA